MECKAHSCQSNRSPPPYPAHTCVSNSATIRTVAHQVPIPVGFPRQEYWSGLPFPPPGDLPDPGIKPMSLHWQADSLPLRHQWSSPPSACTHTHTHTHTHPSIYPVLTAAWITGHQSFFPPLWQSNIILRALGNSLARPMGSLGSNSHTCLHRVTWRT